jgi:HEXXH motif-containing protein
MRAVMAALTPPISLPDLTIPEPGSTTAKTVLSRAMSRLLHDLSAAPRAAPPGARESALALAKLSRTALSSSPGALLSALRRPTVGGLLRCLRAVALPRREEVFIELTAQLAFELAASHALPEPVRLTRAPSRLLSIPRGVAVTLPPGLRSITFSNGSVAADHADGSARVDLDAPASPTSTGALSVERPYHPIAGDIVLAEIDNNPISMFEAHPDKRGNAIDLGGRPVTEWREALSRALGRIERYMPDFHREMAIFLAQIVPVGFHGERHLSASYQEIIGTIYMTLHPSQMTLTEALIHEVSHNKLNALFEIDDVLTNAWSPLYTSPVRPDPRPLHGVLLAVHAFLPVARLYERMIGAGDPEASDDGFHERYATIRKINREGAELVLDKGKPTEVGGALFDEIRRWDEHYRGIDAA